MAFVAGLKLIDAQASALNNSGIIQNERDQNITGVKLIKTKEGAWPYISAQAYRNWLRTTIDKYCDNWSTSPTYKDTNSVAYTDADPIEWHDDDLFGYMRTNKKLTRVSPFRVSTFVSIAPVYITMDYGVMARHEGNPVPYEHQFYRATLKGLFSLDLNAVGTFSYVSRTGYLNLDKLGIEKAQKNNLHHVEVEKAYRLPLEERVKRVAALFEGMALLDGGAKQTLHYTDVSSPLVVLAVTKGGNHVFNYIIGANSRNLPEIKLEALQEALTVFADDILSDIYVGWAKGYLDNEREKLEKFCSENGLSHVKISHPRQAFKSLIEALKKPENSHWLD